MTDFAFDAQFGGWKQAHNTDFSITLYIHPDQEDSARAFFAGMTAKKGKQAGQLVSCLVRLEDDSDAPDAEPGKAKGGALSQLAGMWCNDPKFMTFIRSIYDHHMGGDGSGSGDVLVEDFADESSYCRNCVLVICDIESRAELDHNAKAAEIFQKFIRLPFMHFLRTGEILK